MLCVGAGGLGSPAALYLAAAGVGTVGIIDFDAVDASNLQRQILHSTADVGRPKLQSAREKLSALNPEVCIETHEATLTSANALALFKEYDVILDGTDNFATRYLVNDACVLLGKPNAYGSIFRFEGQASVFATKGGPCYRCLYPEAAAARPGAELRGRGRARRAARRDRDDSGDGNDQAAPRCGKTLAGRLLLYDAWTMRFRELKLRRDVDCPVCGDNPTVRELIDYEQFCGITRPTAAAPSPSALPPELETSVEELKALRASGQPFVLVDVREPHEFQICRIPGLDADPARPAADAAGRTVAEPGRRSSSTASPACEARRPCACCASTASRRAISREASSPGSIGSIRRCRNTERGLGTGDWGLGTGFPDP